MTAEDNLDIPAFLKISAADRTKAWEEWAKAGKLTSASGPESNMSRMSQVRAEERKKKNATALARLKASHPGQHWDNLSRRWVEDV